MSDSINKAKIADLCQSCISQTCTLLKFCSKRWYGFVNDRKSIGFYRKGMRVIFENHPVDGLYFILSGKVKVYKSGVGGKQQILRLAKSEDIIGHRGLNRKTWPVSASTLEDSYICFVPMEDFLSVLNSNPEMGSKLILLMADELCHAENISVELAHLSVREKVALTLIKIYTTYSESGNPMLGVELSRQELADIASTTKEQVSKHLSDFKSESLIDVQGKHISIIDEEMLKGVANYVQF